MLGGVGQQDVAVLPQWGFLPHEVAEMRARENLVQRLDAVDAFGMSLGRHMAERGGMREEQGRHSPSSSRFAPGLL
jgi:hypothetical protein